MLSQLHIAHLKRLTQDHNVPIADPSASPVVIWVKQCVASDGGRVLASQPLRDVMQQLRCRPVLTHQRVELFGGGGGGSDGVGDGGVCVGGRRWWFASVKMAASCAEQAQNTYSMLSTMHPGLTLVEHRVSHCASIAAVAIAAAAHFRL